MPQSPSTSPSSSRAPPYPARLPLAQSLPARRARPSWSVSSHTVGSLVVVGGRPWQPLPRLLLRAAPSRAALQLPPACKPLLCHGLKLARPLLPHSATGQVGRPPAGSASPVAALFISGGSRTAASPCPASASFEQGGGHASASPARKQPPAPRQVPCSGTLRLPVPEPLHLRLVNRRLHQAPGPCLSSTAAPSTHHRQDPRETRCPPSPKNKIVTGTFVLLHFGSPSTPHRCLVRLHNRNATCTPTTCTSTLPRPDQ
ncbi:hypothetical protein VPH35_066717 [Triticum aestivum]